ncbi:hypothetical protein AB0K02_30900 [Streptomyces sp. NPDC049597]|uniref:hypothetical protein n=1 Tax=Streptomyces sp. NPDC049597 TaxID=3155276 RepID=UPI00342F5B3D
MVSLTPNEQRHVTSLAEIRNCPVIESECSDEELSMPLSDILAEEYNSDWEGVIFSGAMQACSLRFAELGAVWSTVGNSPTIKGEFNLVNFHHALQVSDPGTSRGVTDFQRSFLSQLCPIDRTPRSGAGMQTYIRMQADVDDLELWYSDIADIEQPPYPPGFIKLDINYCQYLEALLLTKGTYGWQYLFADVSLASGEFTSKGNYLKNMLQVFPDLFPEHDYSSLVPRLEARL